MLIFLCIIWLLLKDPAKDKGVQGSLLALIKATGTAKEGEPVSVTPLLCIAPT